MASVLDAGTSDAARPAQVPSVAEAGAAPDARVVSDAAAGSAIETGATSDAGPAQAGARDAGAAGAAADASPPASSPRVTIHFTTVNQGGKFSPRNIGAVWIEDRTGTFVKTLTRWAGVFASRLTTFNAISGGNVIDAVTSATAATWGARQAVWDMTDVNHRLVPDGSYQLKIEVTDQNMPGPVFVFPIQKGPGVPDATFPDQQFLIAVSLDYEP